MLKCKGLLGKSFLFFKDDNNRFIILNNVISSDMSSCHILVTLEKSFVCEHSEKEKTSGEKGNRSFKTFILFYLFQSLLFVYILSINSQQIEIVYLHFRSQILR